VAGFVRVSLWKWAFAALSAKRRTRSDLTVLWAARSPPKGEAMSASAVRILVVGHTSACTLATLQRLERDGWNAYSVSTIVEAESVLKIIRFDVVLAGESIGDGSGYDLTEAVLECGATLLVSVALSEASLWLPVVQQGMMTLGDRALNSSKLQLEITELLDKPVRRQVSNSPGKAPGWVAETSPRETLSAADPGVGPGERRGRFAQGGAAPKNSLPPRRRSAGAALISLPNDAGLELEPAKARGVSSDVPGEHFRRHPARTLNRH